MTARCRGVCCGNCGKCALTARAASRVLRSRGSRRQARSQQQLPATRRQVHSDARTTPRTLGKSILSQRSFSPLPQVSHSQFAATLYTTNSHRSNKQPISILTRRIPRRFWYRRILLCPLCAPLFSSPPHARRRSADPTPRQRHSALPMSARYAHASLRDGVVDR